MQGFIVVLGMVGAGKSIQSQELAKRHGWTWLSTGELLRASDDPTTLTAIQAGQLLNDDAIFSLIEPVLASSKANVVILDGFPRRLSQVQWLDHYGQQHTMPVLSALHLNVSPEVAAQRLAQRARSDDTPAGIAARNDEYNQEIKPVIEHYRQAGLLTEINASPSAAEVASHIDHALAKVGLV